MAGQFALNYGEALYDSGLQSVNPLELISAGATAAYGAYKTGQRYYKQYKTYKKGLKQGLEYYDSAKDWWTGPHIGATYPSKKEFLARRSSTSKKPTKWSKSDLLQRSLALPQRQSGSSTMYRRGYKRRRSYGRRAMRPRKFQRIVRTNYGGPGSFKPEQKYFDRAILESLGNTDATYDGNAVSTRKPVRLGIFDDNNVDENCMNLIDQGAGVNQRIGEKIIVTRIQINMSVSIQEGDIIDVMMAPSVRWKLWLVLDTQANGTVANNSDIFSDAPYWNATSTYWYDETNAMLNLANKKRFKILKTWRGMLKPNTEPASTSTWAGVAKHIEYYKKCKIPIYMADNTAGGGAATISNVRTNNLYLFGAAHASTMTSTWVPTTNFVGQFRLRFADS